MIEIRQVHKSYGASEVLRGVDLTAPAGEIVLLLGANGAGKSTLFRCLLGLTSYRGSIRVAGLDPLRRGREVRRRVGYMPQQHGLQADMSVQATVDFYSALRGVAGADAERLLAEARLENERASRVDELSGGMRQRLAFALAQLGDPPVLLLDEPTASLDARSRDRLMARLAELAAGGKTILIATHVEPGVAVGRRRSVMLDAGRLQPVPSAATGSSLRRAAPRAFAGGGVVGWMVDTCGNASGGDRC